MRTWSKQVHPARPMISRRPGSRGHTRIQRELRQLAVMPAPTALQDRAAFCLCLATNYAGFVSGMLPLERPVRGS